jgi:hypothetical protein
MNWLYTKRSILQGTVQQDIQSLDRFDVIYVELAELLHSNAKSWLFVQRMTSQHKLVLWVNVQQILVRIGLPISRWLQLSLTL